MGIKMYLRVLSVILLAFVIVFVSCGDDEGYDFNKGREIYMSNNVAFLIIFPKTQDTIFYRDTTSGFTTWVQNDSLYLRDISIKDDSLTFHDKKYYISFDLSFTHTNLGKVINGVRELGCSGKAEIMFDTLRVGRVKTPLKVSTITGSVDDNEVELFGGLLPEEEQPYVVMRSIGKRIH